MKAQKGKIQKCRVILQNAMVLVVVLSGVLLYIQYSNGLITEGKSIQVFAGILIPLVAMELVGSLVTGQSLSKGVVVNRESTPKLYFLNNIVSAAVLAICVFGVIHYA